MRRKIKALAVCVSFFAASATGLCQVREARVHTQSISGDGTNLFIGPDPEEPESWIRLLIYPNVIEELHLTASEVEALKRVQATSSKIVGNLVDAMRQKRMTDAEFTAVNETRKADLASSIEEIITPGKAERLKQLAYRCEVAEGGWELALTRGRLSLVAGVHENQHDALVRAIAKIEREKLAAISEAKREAEQKILDQLAPEQRELAKKTLGLHFDFQSTSGFDLLVKEALKNQAKRDED